MSESKQTEFPWLQNNVKIVIIQYFFFYLDTIIRRLSEKKIGKSEQKRNNSKPKIQINRKFVSVQRIDEHMNTMTDEYSNEQCSNYASKRRIESRQTKKKPNKNSKLFEFAREHETRKAKCVWADETVSSIHVRFLLFHFSLESVRMINDGNLLLFRRYYRYWSIETAKRLSFVSEAPIYSSSVKRQLFVCVHFLAFAFTDFFHHFFRSLSIRLVFGLLIFFPCRTVCELMLFCDLFYFEKIFTFSLDSRQFNAASEEFGDWHCHRWVVELPMTRDKKREKS